MKRVYIFASRSFFGSGIRCLIGNEETVEIVGHNVDPERALAQIAMLQPDVVLMDREGGDTDFALKALHMLDWEVGRRVIGLDLHENVLWVFRKERRIVHDADDLMRAIFI